MKQNDEEKRIFLIAVTDKDRTINRVFQETILDLLSNQGEFRESYTIEPHNRTTDENLYDSIDEAISGNKYEGYIVVLDCLDIKNGLFNPNVMFEFGAIKYLKNPFVVISANPDADFPFDVRNLNMAYIPKAILDYARQCYDINTKPNILYDIESQKFSDGDKEEINEFLYEVYQKYQASLKLKTGKRKNIDNIDILEEVKQIRKLLSNTTEYIEGEEEAFKALHKAVIGAKDSLRTSRFAN